MNSRPLKYGTMCCVSSAPIQLPDAIAPESAFSVVFLTMPLIAPVAPLNALVKILPQFKYRPNDAPDFNIYCYISYERELNGQPQVDYSEIYSFYDRKKNEYLAQNGDPYGIFDNDTSEKNRDVVKTFIKLPDDYDDMAGDQSGD
jgi:hypothetical protein